MNCDAIDSILDERRSALLPDSQRQRLAAHLTGCRRCADSWTAHEALAAEHMGEPPPELWARVLQRVPEARQVRAAAGRGAWLGAAGLAAAAAVAVFAVRVLITTPGDETSSGGAEPAAASEHFAADPRYVQVARPALAEATGDKIAVQAFFQRA